MTKNERSKFSKGISKKKKRVEIVDMLRGAYPVPIDFKELSMIGQILELDKKTIFIISGKSG